MSRFFYFRREGIICTIFTVKLRNLLPTVYKHNFVYESSMFHLCLILFELKQEEHLSCLDRARLFHRFSLNSRQSKSKKFSKHKGFCQTTGFFIFTQGKFQISPIKMKGFFAKLKDFSPKLKVSEIMLLLKLQNR